jgi:hypothetical protein
MGVYLESQRLIRGVTRPAPTTVRPSNGRKVMKASEIPKLDAGLSIHHALTAPIVYSGSRHPELSPQCPLRVITEGCTSTGPTLAPCRVRTK